MHRWPSYRTHRIIIRAILWLEGRGKKMMHVVKWKWYGLSKDLGGLGIKDLRQQGIALEIKWIVKTLEGNEPWKILIRTKFMIVNNYNILGGNIVYKFSWFEIIVRYV